MSSKVWVEITCPFPNFNGATVEVWEWISNFISHIIIDVKLNHVTKRDLRGPFHLHGLTLIPAWICNHIHLPTGKSRFLWDIFAHANEYARIDLALYLYWAGNWSNAGKINSAPLLNIKTIFPGIVIPITKIRQSLEWLVFIKRSLMNSFKNGKKQQYTCLRSFLRSFAVHSESLFHSYYFTYYLDHLNMAQTRFIEMSGHKRIHFSWW